MDLYALLYYIGIFQEKIKCQQSPFLLILHDGEELFSRRIFF